MSNVMYSEDCATVQYEVQSELGPVNAIEVRVMRGACQLDGIHKYLDML